MTIETSTTTYRTERDADRARREAEERTALQALAAAKRARLLAGRQVVHEWLWQVPKRPIAKPEPVLDIVERARQELAKSGE
jgi:hypothetical protein